jgi:hypothetical protein
MVVVQVEAVKIYVAAVEALRRNERQDETQVTTKIDGETNSGLMPYYGYVVKIMALLRDTQVIGKLRV